MSVNIVPGSRLYAEDAAQYGNALRANVLGLENTPAIALDNGSSVAYFGPNRSKVVDPTTKKTLTGNDTSSVSLPLDVKTVGNNQLNALGIPAEQQTAMFAKWNALSDSQKSDNLSKWNALDKSNADELRQFVQSMVDALS